MCFYSFDRDCPLNVVNISITGMNTLVSVSGQSSEQPIASVSWQGTHQGHKVLSSLAVSFKKKNRLYSLEKFQVHSKLRGRCRHFPSISCRYTCVCSPSINNSDPCAPQQSVSLFATDKPTLMTTSLSPKVRSLHQVYFNSWIGKIPWRRDRLPTPVFLGFPGGSEGKESTCNEGDLGSIPGLGRSSGGGCGNQLQYSCLKNPQGQRSLAGYSPWGHDESDMTKHSTDTMSVIVVS